MGISYNSSISKEGLILYLDAGNVKSAKGRLKNILSWNDWVAGTSGGITSTGSWPSYWANGDGNRRVSDTNPFGVTDVVWDVSNQDAASDADGGWEGAQFSIDPTKTYRYSTWVRRKTIGNGNFYLGPHSNWGAVAGAYILNRSNGAENQNPYFVAQGWWGNANDWYLVVGHVWAAGSGAGSSHPDSGIYTTAGVKLSSATDYMWAPTNTTSFHRSYLYYSTDITTNQQWYQPRVEICDGTEPTIAELLSDVGNKVYDLSGKGYTATLRNSPSYANRTLQFRSSSTQYATCSFNEGVLTSANNNGSWTIETWFKYVSPPPGGESIVAGRAGCHGGIYLNNNNTLDHAIKTDQCWTGASIVTAATVSTGSWYCSTMVYNNGTTFSYTNGIYVSSATLNLSLYSIHGYGNTFYIGGIPTTFCTNTDIGIVKCYNTALTPSQIVENFNAMRGRYGI